MVLNNTLNSRDGRYPRATARPEHKRLQSYIVYYYYDIITTVLRMRKKTKSFDGYNFFRVNVTGKKTNVNIYIQTLAETREQSLLLYTYSNI